MLSAIRDIGDLVIQKSCEVQEQIQGKILLINLDSGKSSYIGIDIEDFDSERYKKNWYLFKQGASKGNMPSPFCPLTEPAKSYKKIEGWLKQCHDINDNTLKDDRRYLISKVWEVLSIKKEEIITAITLKATDIPRREPKFLTIKIDGKYPGEYEVFNKCVVIFDEEKRKRSANSGVCSICSMPDKEVSGKTDVFRFYTIDKPGFITGGFQEPQAWKNFPVCQECRTFMENGRKFLEGNLNFKFYGLSYLLIPRLLTGGQSLLAKLLDIFSGTAKTVALKERIKNRITIFMSIRKKIFLSLELRMKTAN